MWHLATWHPANDTRPMTSISGVPCFFNYIIYIFIGQNDTTIQPMTSGPVTADHVASIIGVPFLQSIIYIYIHGPKRHDHSANDIRPSEIHHWSAVFKICYIYIYIHWPKRHDHSANDIRPSDIHHWSAVFTIYYIYIYSLAKTIRVFF